MNKNFIIFQTLNFPKAVNVKRTLSNCAIKFVLHFDLVVRSIIWKEYLVNNRSIKLYINTRDITGAPPQIKPNYNFKITTNADQYHANIIILVVSKLNIMKQNNTNSKAHLFEYFCKIIFISLNLIFNHPR